MKKPSETKNCYERLEISKNASDEEIKKAYRKQALKYHPDMNNGNEESSKIEFIAISEAYENLMGKEPQTENIFEYYSNMFFEYEKYFRKAENKELRNSGEFLGKFFRGGF